MLEALADPAEARVAELVLLALDGLHRALLRHGSLGDDDDRVAAALVAAADQPAHLLNVEEALGDQDHIGAAGQLQVQGDPAGVATITSTIITRLCDSAVV